ncbi:rano class II histocompatibility antigen, A beta chain-like [Genypterus blacodes]|uniref:rano class II histocompatibility antigen, A beta chain-like n=1 Tax=Genypterus blacodes TaxID=154954 RepID=UPI003F757D82
MASSFLGFTLLFIGLYGAEGFRNLVLERCVFNSSDLKDIEYIYSAYYNKVEFARFSSSVGKFVGYTVFGMKQAENWNNNPSQLAQKRHEKERYCKNHVDAWYPHFLTKTAKPHVKLSSETPPAGQHPTRLVCSAYNFFPKEIHVTWYSDGKEITSGVSSTEEQADGDWYYQIHSHLEYTPRSGEKITCVVDHASLEHSLITNWDPSLPESEKNKIAIGASGLILGVILSLAGFIYYKRKHRGRILVPSN